jgi:hypothetical protein
LRLAFATRIASAASTAATRTAPGDSRRVKDVRVEAPKPGEPYGKTESSPHPGQRFAEFSDGISILTIGPGDRDDAEQVKRAVSGRG